MSLTVSDDWGGTDTQSFDLDVFPDVEPPSVDLRLDRDKINVDSELTVTVLAVDNVGVHNVSLTIDGVPVELDGAGQATVPVSQAGTVEVIASVVDTAGNMNDFTETVLVVDPSVTGAPEVRIDTPATDAVITAPTDVVGVAKDDDLLFYTLSIGLAGGGPMTEIARSTTSVDTGVLGQFDPTLLTNDSYVLQLYAVDSGGNESTTEIMVNVTGALKVGNFTLSFVDLEVPVSGVPITLARTYDTMTAGQDNGLGYGWRLEFRDADLRTSVGPSGLEEFDLYTPFREGTRVYITLPGGEREGFIFRPIHTGFCLFQACMNVYRPNFVPEPGVYSTLTVPDVDLALRGLEYYDAGATGVPYNPASSLFGSVYTLTTKDGIEYDINARTGQLYQVTDTNDNTLSFSRNGIISSTGKSIAFERDPRGRISKVIDPMGNEIQYAYDVRGDLVSVTDREGQRDAVRIPGLPGTLS